MHTPRHFRTDDPAREARLIRENPFGLIVSAGAGGAGSDDGPAGGIAPVATHVPMLRRPGPGGPPADDEPLPGTMIIGHLARINPQWKALRPGQPVLAVFLGPDGYVSPTVYGSSPSVPTWNYAAVHVTGTVRLVDDRDEAWAIIQASVDATEAYAGTDWDRTPSVQYIGKLLAAIVAFEITVTEVRSTFKLSQNKPAETQRRVHASFARSRHGRDRELAALMADMLDLSA
ncbi:FMN-binding negative transcriptional regulator [Jiangella asiatica]|nr:FMN-binding negative transcriptional regulator [Jiangella asiatica]